MNTTKENGQRKKKIKFVEKKKQMSNEYIKIAHHPFKKKKLH